MSKIEYKVPVGDSGKVANMTVPSETIGDIYANWEGADGGIYESEERVSNDIRFTTFNSTLNFEPIIREGGEAAVAIMGNTVDRLCPKRPEGVISCEDCAIAGLDFRQRLDANCARANSEFAFGQAAVAPHERFVMTPTKNEVIVLGDEMAGDPQIVGGELAFNKLPPASLLIVTEDSLKSLDIDKIGIGMNGADATFGIMTVAFNDERALMAFCSQRSNMGDRTEDEEIYRKGFDALFNHFGLEGDARSQAIADMKVEVTYGASAKEAKDFRFNFSVPSLDSEDEKVREKAQKVLDKHNAKYGTSETVVTRLMVIDDMYPGSVDNGMVYAPFEAGMIEVSKDMDVDISRKWDRECPDECCLDYYRETNRTILNQMKDMGIAETQISIDTAHTLNTADTANNAASNRAEQLGGVITDKTNRTLNAAVVSFDKR